jgi:hypothetical protein
LELAEKVGCRRPLVNMYLNKKGYIWKLAKWVPHELTPSNREKRYKISLNNLQIINNFDLNKYLVTMDEIMIIFKNYRHKHIYRKPSQPLATQPKQPKHPINVMLSIWWHYDGVICYHLLDKDVKIGWFKYRTQLYLFDFIYKRSCANKLKDGVL